MMRSRRRWMMSWCTALCAVTARLDAQRCGPGQDVPWWPRSYLSPTTASERAAMDPLLAAVEALARKTAYGSPRGYAVRPAWSYGGELRDKARLHSWFFAPVLFFECSKYDEHGADLEITFNPSPMTWSQSDRPLLDESGDGLYQESLRSEPLFGSTATYGHFEEPNSEGLFVLFTRAGESPTVPVTREAWIRAQIFTFEGKNQEKLKEAIAATLQLYANDSIGREKTLAGLKAPGNRMRSQIEAMTPDVRASPAWTNGLDLVPAGTPGAFAIVRENPSFYRARTSPFEVRAILVRWPGAREEMKAIHEQVYREFDWEGLKKLLAP